MFIDAYGLIVQANGDGGDTLARTGNYHSMNLSASDQFEKALNVLEVAPGVYVRHPDVAAARPTFKVSRDQQLALIYALGDNGKQKRLWRLFKQHVKRAFVYPNGDSSFFATVAAYLRGFKQWLTWPLLEILDIEQIADMLIHVGVLPRWKHETQTFVKQTPDDVGDDMLFVQKLVFSARTMPTLTNWITRRLYAKFRPVNNGNLFLGEKSPVMGAISWYCREEAGGNPEIAEAYRAQIVKYIDKDANERSF